MKWREIFSLYPFFHLKGFLASLNFYSSLSLCSSFFSLFSFLFQIIVTTKNRIGFKSLYVTNPGCFVPMHIHQKSDSSFILFSPFSLSVSSLSLILPFPPLSLIPSFSSLSFLLSHIFLLVSEIAFFIPAKRNWSTGIEGVVVNCSGKEEF